jgi:nitrogen regulatory protein PII
MKLVVAVIRPEMLEDVVLALQDIHALAGASISETRGFGRQPISRNPPQTADLRMDLRRFTRLEMLCLDHQAPGVASAIEVAARTGRAGDGSIFVLPVETGIRISTGERGDADI